MANSGHPYLTGRDTDEIKNVQFGVNTFTGAGDAGRLAALDDGGRLPMSLLPTQVTSGTANNVGFTGQIPDTIASTITGPRIGVANQVSGMFNSNDDSRIAIQIASARDTGQLFVGTLYFIYTEDGSDIVGGSVVRAVSRGLVPFAVSNFNPIRKSAIYLSTATPTLTAGLPTETRPTYVTGNVEIILGYAVSPTMIDFNPQILHQYT